MVPFANGVILIIILTFIPRLYSYKNNLQTELIQVSNEEQWIPEAIKDVAYSLRYHKFNELDRRLEDKMAETVSFYKVFPIPRLQSINWEVYENCCKDFHKCLKYLHSVMRTFPFSRNDDIITTINKKTLNTNIPTVDEKCKKALSYSEKTGLPFDGPTEKFIWRASASYYMCWYTLIGIPELSMLGEPCDNFAQCLDPEFGYKNYDPRADDKVPFACAMYSFCPDPCCPLKHVDALYHCYYSEENPCFIENSKRKNILQKQCYFNRSNNIDLNDIIANKWNISCYCEQKGFGWEPKFGMCVDINECATGNHDCDAKTEDCFNVPGSHKCVCKWGYTINRSTNKCVENNLFVELQPEVTKCFDWIEDFKKIF